MIAGMVLAVACLPVIADIERSFSKTDEEIDRFYGVATPARGAEAQHASLQRLREMAQEAYRKTPDEVVPLLGEGLRKLTLKNIFQVKERVEVYDLVQSTLLNIPGHARYFAEEIKREQKEVANYPTITGPRCNYDRNRAKYFNTLALLPSPETIAVLGEFLADDIDTPQPLMSPDSDWGENPRANSYAASVTISAIGLRDAPADKKSYGANPETHLAKSRAWWDEVKSGKRTFSFQGQNVEYRFKPDGSWDTILIANPRDDGPKSTSEIKIDRGGMRSVPEQIIFQAVSRRISWLWYGIGGTAMLAACAWFWRKKR